MSANKQQRCTRSQTKFLVTWWKYLHTYKNCSCRPGRVCFCPKAGVKMSSTAHYLFTKIWLVRADVLLSFFCKNHHTLERSSSSASPFPSSQYMQITSTYASFCLELLHWIPTVILLTSGIWNHFQNRKHACVWLYFFESLQPWTHRLASLLHESYCRNIIPKSSPTDPNLFPDHLGSCLFVCKSCL